MRLVSVDKHTLELKIEPIAVTTTAFKKVINKGNNKEYTIKELLYITCMVDPLNSPPLQAGHEGKVLHTESVRHCNLPVDYKPDKFVEAAMEYYKNEYLGAQGKYLQTLLSSFGSNIKLANLLKNRIKQILDDAEESGEEISTDDVSNILKSQKQLFDLIESAPKAVKMLNSLFKEANSERKEILLGRGDIEITDSMRD